MGHPFLHRDSPDRQLIMCRCIAHRLLTMLASLVLVGNVSARPFDDVIDSGSITIFVYSDYAPYSWGEGDEAQGIDVEIARAIGESLGVKTELLIRGADENLDDDLRVNIWKGDLINRKAADVMLHVPFDREVDIRNELAVLASPYFQEQMAVVVDTDKLPEVDTFGWFLSNPIAVELDTAGDFFLSNAFRGQLHNSIRRGRTFDAAADSFFTGEAPALMASRAQTEWVARQAAEHGINTDVIQPPMPGIVRTGWPIGIAVKHDSRDLGYAVGDVLTEMIDSGRMQELYASYGVKWLPPEIK